MTSFITTLPQAVIDLVEMTPVEDLLLHLLRERLPDIQVQSLIAADQTFPLVLIRNTGTWGDWDGDQRFLDAGSIQVNCFTRGINADIDGSLLSDAVRVAIRDSVNKVVPGRGHITYQRLIERGHRATDWATSSGPVQYADLPQGVLRYESTFEIAIRRPFDKPIL